MPTEIGPDDPMIEEAWNEYRGWAKRARSLQANAGRWNQWAMIALVVTGVLGAASGFFGANPTDWLPGSLSSDQFARALACAAALTSALSLYVGRQALAVGAESGGCARGPPPRRSSRSTSASRAGLVTMRRTRLPTATRRARSSSAAKRSRPARPEIH
jgi:hypothetical protein